MNPDEIKQWLEPEEWGHYTMAIEIEKIPQASVGTWVDVARVALERLAACRKLSEQRRVLMEKHEWDGIVHVRGSLLYDHCLECKCRKDLGHGLNCLWAKAIEKGE